MPDARPPLLTLEQALVCLLDGAREHRIAEKEEVPTASALGRVLAQGVKSGLNVPPLDNTSMDGYAVRCADLPADGELLRVDQRIPAGQVGEPLKPGSAARIFTGAPIPPGADAVVMQEDCEALQDGRVRIARRPQLGQWVRRRGEDIAIGAEVLKAGQRLNPQALGLAASVGCAHVSVLRRPRVALFSTGDELSMPGTPLKAGGIYNSNRFTLTGLLLAAQCEVRDVGIVPDRLQATREALREAAAGNDLVLTSGGVSVGEEDHLRPAVQAEGHLELWQVAIKPGKPLAFGKIRRPDGSQALYIGLPGNPVSSFVTFLLAVVPLLRSLQAETTQPPAGLHLRADFDWPQPDRRREFLRVKVNMRGGLDPYPNQSSGVLTSTVWGDGLADVPPGQALRAGDLVRFLPWSALVP